MSAVRVSCHRLAPAAGDLRGNCERVADTLSSAADAGADVIVLPELATSGHVFESGREAASAALTAGEVFALGSVALWGSAAVAVVGFCERGEHGRLYNSAAVMDADGGFAVYRKAHLSNAEKRFFTAGSEPPPVVPTAAGRLGVLVGHDLEFPQLTGLVALAGADLLAVPGDWPLPGAPSAGTMIARAAARTNRFFVACCDRAGTRPWAEGTVIVDRDGRVVAAPDADGTAVAAVEFGLAKSRRSLSISAIR
ncbi:hydrolase [Amycolatopsis sp. NBC_00345]|uniref:nitrilase-related carbon-nitrogen hydrolase n=1 Tax=Amycolatopsis sp. NBC_00345 TaxID=2975955 RepID=UPI002E255D03